MTKKQQKAGHNKKINGTILRYLNEKDFGIIILNLYHSLPMSLSQYFFKIIL
jgi:hypothetical protein